MAACPVCHVDDLNPPPEGTAYVCDECAEIGLRPEMEPGEEKS